MNSLKNDWFIERWVDCGEAAIICYFSGRQLTEQNSRVLHFVNCLKATCPSWITEIVPSFDSVMICYDPLNADQYRTIDWIGKLPSVEQGSNQEQNHIIRVDYDRAGAFDLISLADSVQRTPDSIIRCHVDQQYRVFAIGFAPGFAYAGEVKAAIQFPRRSTPRTKVPAGAIAIADSYTAVYPDASPGGWNVIGMLANNEQPMRDRNLCVGDSLTFVDCKNE